MKGSTILWDWRMGKTLFKSIKEMKAEDKKGLVKSIFTTIALAVFLSGVGLTLYSCKSEVPSVESYKVETNWVEVLSDSTWVKQSCRIAALDSIQRIRFTMVDERNWKVRLEASDSQRDEGAVVIDKDSGSLSYGSAVMGLHLSEHDGYWLRLTSVSGEVADFIFEN